MSVIFSCSACAFLSKLLLHHSPLNVSVKASGCQGVGIGDLGCGVFFIPCGVRLLSIHYPLMCVDCLGALFVVLLDFEWLFDV